MKIKVRCFYAVKTQNRINSFLQEVYLKGKGSIMRFIQGIIEILQLKVRMHRY